MKAKIINEKGKLFGIINVIDLIVLVVILAVIAAGVKFFKNGGFSLMGADSNDGFSGPETTLQMKFFSEEVNDFVVDNLYMGAELYDDTDLQSLGYITNIETAPSVTYGGNSDGDYILTSREGFKSVVITGEINGQRTPLGATINGKHYSSGHSFVLRAGDAKIYLRVYDVEAKPRRLRRPIPDQTNTTSES